MVVTDRDYDVTGDLTPDAAGYYDIAGVHNGENYLRRHDGAYFVWWDGAFSWNISIGLDVKLPGSWSKFGHPLTGDYVPVGTYLGVPTVTEHHDS